VTQVPATEFVLVQRSIKENDFSSPTKLIQATMLISDPHFHRHGVGLLYRFKIFVSILKIVLKVKEPL
jgi:hypothetical protein